LFENCVRPAPLTENWGKDGRQDVGLFASGGEKKQSNNDSNVRNGKPVAGFKGIAYGVASYIKGVSWDLPKHLLSRYGAFGEEAEIRAVRGEYSTIEASRLIVKNPADAVKIAYRGFELLPPDQQAYIQGRILGRVAFGLGVSAASPPIGMALGVGAATGNVLDAGVDVEDQAAVIRTVLEGAAR
jgi:hypothetical protein